MTPPKSALSKREFIALIAMHSAMVAFSIDAMLPALPEIAQAITPDAPNRAQLILTSFVFGMGVGTLFSGPLSDAFGRRPVIFAGAFIYCVGSVWAVFAGSIEEMVIARILQGLGVAGPRVVALAIVRDLYAGRGMAQIMSFVMIVFSIVPALAPAIGALIVATAGWRAIFLVFVIFCLAVVAWLALRQPETHPPDARTPFRLKSLKAALLECLSHKVFVYCALAQTMAFGMLFGNLSTIQPLFLDVFDKGDSFPAWFALIALVSATSSLINARLVMRLGMWRLIVAGLVGELIITIVILGVALSGHLTFAAFLFWQTSLFFMVGLVLGNLNAMAMEPLGHIAGMASSILGSVATVLGVLIAVPIGLLFNGTAIPLAAGIFVICLIAVILTVTGLRPRPVAPH